MLVSWGPPMNPPTLSKKGRRCNCAEMVRWQESGLVAFILWDRSTEEEVARFKNIVSMVDEKRSHPISKLDDCIKHFLGTQSASWSLGQLVGRSIEKHFVDKTIQCDCLFSLRSSLCSLHRLFLSSTSSSWTLISSFSSSMWMSSEQDPLCTSPNEESGPLASNAPLTMYGLMCWHGYCKDLRRLQETDVVRNYEGVRLQGHIYMVQVRKGKETAFTHTQPGERRQEQKSQLDYIIGLRREDDDAIVYNDDKLWDIGDRYLISTRIQEGKSSKKSIKARERRSGQDGGWGQMSKKIRSRRKWWRMAKTGLTKIWLQYRRLLRFPLVTWRTTRIHEKDHEESAKETSEESQDWSLGLINAVWCCEQEKQSKPPSELYVNGNFKEDSDEWQRDLQRQCEEVYTDQEETREVQENWVLQKERRSTVHNGSAQCRGNRPGPEGTTTKSMCLKTQSWVSWSRTCHYKGSWKSWGASRTACWVRWMLPARGRLWNCFLRKPDAEPKKGNQELQFNCANHCHVEVVRVLCDDAHGKKEKEPETWNRFHMGGVNKISFQHLQVLVTNLSQKHWEWQEERSRMLQHGSLIRPTMLMQAWASRQPSTRRGRGILRWDFVSNSETYKNTKFEVEIFFNITQMWVVEHSEEILKVKFLESSSLPWTRSVLSHVQAIKWANAIVRVYSDSVQCVGQMNESKVANSKRKIWREGTSNLKSSRTRSSSIYWSKKGTDGICISNAESQGLLDEILERTLDVSGSQENGKEVVYLLTFQGEWDSTANELIQRFKEFDHLVFESISALSRGILKEG